MSVAAVVTHPVPTFVDFGSGATYDQITGQLQEAVSAAMPVAIGIVAVLVGLSLVKWLVYDASRAGLKHAGVSTFELAAVAAISEWDDEDEDDDDPVSAGLVAEWNDSDHVEHDDEGHESEYDPHDDVRDVLDSDEGEDV